ncbi:hypothetical protein B296_00028536 [Ensete ventricosum]|uniref:Uncharacterized protein n=1 Tax=Ensete ventricosum TaxID=4639 RepID=A0A426ZIX7_ENSVE|nr:hypothetical protein B296_00028536 [Ensete ventricosum]
MRGWQWLLQRRGGSGCVAATRAVNGGCSWLRKDNDYRQEEAAGASAFGVAVAAGEMAVARNNYCRWRLELAAAIVKKVGGWLRLQVDYDSKK